MTSLILIKHDSAHVLLSTSALKLFDAREVGYLQIRVCTCVFFFIQLDFIDDVLEQELVFKIEITCVFVFPDGDERNVRGCSETIAR